MTFEVDGFDDLQDDLEEWAAQVERANPEVAKAKAANRVIDKLAELVKRNIDQIPHALSALRNSWKKLTIPEERGTQEIYTEKDYASVFEYGHVGYTIDPDGWMAFDPEERWDDWDPNHEANDVYMTEDGNWVIGEVEHPGFFAWRYLGEAMRRLEERHVEDIVEEAFIEELQKAFGNGTPTTTPFRDT